MELVIYITERVIIFQRQLTNLQGLATLAAPYLGWRRSLAHIPMYMRAVIILWNTGPRPLSCKLCFTI